MLTRSNSEKNDLPIWSHEEDQRQLLALRKEDTRKREQLHRDIANATMNRFTSDRYYLEDYSEEVSRYPEARILGKLSLHDGDYSGESIQLMKVVAKLPSGASQFQLWVTYSDERKEDIIPTYFKFDTGGELVAASSGNYESNHNQQLALLLTRIQTWNPVGSS